MTKQRILAMLLSVLMVFSLLPVGVMAQEPEEALVEEELVEEPEETQAEEEPAEEAGENQEETLESGDAITLPEVEVGEDPIDAATEVTVSYGTTSTNYSTLADAFAAAVAVTTDAANIIPVTIKLNASCEIDTRISVRAASSDMLEHNITLDLNGYNITYSGSNNGIFLLNSAHLTITGTGNVDAGTNETYAYIASLNNKVSGNSTTSILTISGGTYTNLKAIVSTSISSLTGRLVITGGTFSVDPSAYKADGYEVVSNGTDPETYTVTTKTGPKTYEASVKIGEAEAQDYETLKNAVTAANEASGAVTIKLLLDADISSTLEFSAADVTLDLNGKAITNNGTVKTITIKSGSTEVPNKLIITDTSEGKAGKITGATGYTANGSVIYVNGDASFTLEAGTLATGSTSSAIHLYKATGKGNPVLAITGGKVEGAITYPSNSANYTSSISGGAFTVKPADTLMADGYEAVSDGAETPTYNIQEKTTITYVAEVKIGEAEAQSYDKFSDAFDAANAAEEAAVIKLLEDVSGSITVTGEDITLDLNGHKFTADPSKRAIAVKPATGATAALTVKDSSEAQNGVIEGSSTFADKGNAVYAYSNGTFALESGTVKGVNDEYSAIQVYGTSTAIGYITISGGMVYGSIATGSSKNTVITVTGGWFSASPKSYIPDEGYGVVEVKDESMAATPYAVTDTCGQLVYDINGGDETTLPEAKTVYYVEGYTVKVNLTTVTPDGSGNFVFEKWNTKADGTGIDYESGEKDVVFTPDAGKMTLYAIYKESFDYVAKIGETGYVSLTKALKAAGTDTEEPVTITLVADVTENVTVAVGQNIILDIGGYNITGAGTGSAISNNGTLAITGTTGIISGVAQSKGGGIDNFGTLTINGGIISGTAASGGAIYNRENASLTINGGTVSGSFPDETTDGQGETIYSYDELTINGGTVEGGIYSRNKLTINGGTVESGIYLGSYSKTVAAINGGTIDGDITLGALATLSISGGQINGDIDVKAEEPKLTITGGTFASFNPAAYMPENCEFEGEEAPFKVVFYAASVNGIRYNTLSEAIEAAEEGDTVLFLGDLTGDITLEKKIFIDLNGKTLDGEIKAGEGLAIAVDAYGIYRATAYDACSVTIEGETTYYTTFTEAAEAAGGVYVIMVTSWDAFYEGYTMSVNETLRFVSDEGWNISYPGFLDDTCSYWDGDLDAWVYVFTCYAKLSVKAEIGGEKTSVAYVGGDAIEVAVYEELGDELFDKVDPTGLVWTIVSGSEYITEVTPGVYSAVKAGGTVTVKAEYPDDPVGRGVSVSFTTAEQPLEYKVVYADDAEETAITEISEEFTGEAINVTVKAVGENIVKTTAVSSDKSIVAVKANKDGTWLLTLSKDKKNTGACTVTFTPYVLEGKKTVAKTPYVIDVTLTDYTPEIAEKITINANDAWGTGFEVIEKAGNEIYEATLVGNDGKGNPVETAELPVYAWYNCGELYVCSNKVFTGTVKTLVKFTTEKGDMYVPLAITAKNTSPKATVKQLSKISTYDGNSEAKFGLNLTGTDYYWLDPASVTVEAEGYTASVTYGYECEEYEYNIVVSLKRDADATAYAKAAVISYTLDAYHEGVNKGSVKANIATVTKPSLSLTPASSVINAGGDKLFSIEVYDKNLGQILTDLTADNLVLPEGYEICEAFKVSAGEFIIEATGNLNAKNTIAIEVKPEGWNQSVVLKYTLNVVSKDPTVKLSSSTVTLNGGITGSYARTEFTVDQANKMVYYTVEPVKGNENIVFTDDSGNEVTAEINKKVYAYTGCGLTAEVADTVPAGSYKYNVKLYNNYKEDPFKTLSLTVKVVDKAVTISAKAVKTIDGMKVYGLDVTRPDSCAVYELTLSNIDKACTIDFSGDEYTSDVRLLDPADTSKEDDRFEAWAYTESGKTYLIIYPKDGVTYTASSYSFIVAATVQGVDVYSGKLTVKMANTKLKLNSDATSATLSQAAAKAGRTLTYTITVNDPDWTGFEIGNVTIGKVDGIFRKSLADSGSDITWNVSDYGRTLTVYVTVDNTCRLVRNKTYTLPLVITPVCIGTEAMAAKSAAEVKLTLKVTK